MIQTTIVTEEDMKARLDDALSLCGLFGSLYSEVKGTIVQPRIGTRQNNVIIDRIAIPNQKFINMGWKLGAIGFEVKATNIPVSKAAAQAMDYSRAIYHLPSGFDIGLRWVYIVGSDYESKWRAAPYGLLDHFRIGFCKLGVSDDNRRLTLSQTFETHLIIDRFGRPSLHKSPVCGNKAGSR